MTEDLFFVPIIAGALRATAPQEALRDAFERIHMLGRQEVYRTGYTHFRQFMSAVAQTVDGTRDGRDGSMGEDTAALLIDPDVKAIEQMGKALDGNAPVPAELWQDLQRQMSPALRSVMGTAPGPGIILEREGAVVDTCAPNRLGQDWVIDGITPGRYVLQLDTGRVLWDEQLDERDLVWAVAFPGEPLRMAADTGQEAGRPTRRANLLAGSIILCVFSGVETGSISIRVAGSEPQT